MLNKAIKKAKENKKGFTLAELLIVVAIIAVLVAISIPIFNSQLEKSRYTVSVSNIRAAYAEASAACLTSNGQAVAKNGNVTVAATAEDGTQTVTVENVQLKGQASGWSDQEKELSFTHAGMTADIGGQPGTYTATFKFTLSSGACELTTLGKATTTGK